MPTSALVAAEVLVEHVDLAVDLRVGDVLRGAVPDHVHDHRNAHGALELFRPAGGQEGERAVLDRRTGVPVGGRGVQQAAVHEHRTAGAAGRDVVTGRTGADDVRSVRVPVHGAAPGTLSRVAVAATLWAAGRDVFVVGHSLAVPSFPHGALCPLRGSVSTVA